MRLPFAVAWAAGVSVASVALLSLLSGIVSATVPTPEFAIDVEAVQDGRLITYTIRFENVGSGPATSAVLRDVLPAGTTYFGDAKDLVNGVWTKNYTDLSPGAYSETLSVELPEASEDGDLIVNFVELRFMGWAGGWQVAAHTLETRASFPATPPSSSLPSWIVAAPAAPAAAAVVGFVAYRKRRAPKLEQVFLMHNSGMLIHHWAANVSPSRDIDILSGMFVILKEFVRDSFREKTGGMTELQFGDSRVFLAEGRHSILAAVVQGNHVNGLPGQIQAAVEDFERRHGGALVGWSGRLDHVPDAKAVVDGLVRGKYGYRRLAA